MAPRVLPGSLLALVVLTATVAAALVSGPSGGPVEAWLAGTSGGVGAGLGGLGAALPFGVAFAAGMLAAVNPCGFVLLPAYVGRYLVAGGREPRGGLLLRALRFSGAVTAGFIALFAGAGLLLGAVGAVLEAALPWLGLVVGVLLVAAGALAVIGGPVPALVPVEAWAWRLHHQGGAAGEGLCPADASRGPREIAVAGCGFRGVGSRADAPDEGAAGHRLLGHVAYGVAYGLASLGCALPAFLTVVGGATTQGFLGAVGLFVLYGLGLGVVLTLASLAVGWFGTEVVARLGRVRRLTPALAAALLLLAGASVTYYWLTVGGILARLLAPG